MTSFAMTLAYGTLAGTLDSYLKRVPPLNGALTCGLVVTITEVAARACRNLAITIAAKFDFKLGNGIRLVTASSVVCRIVVIFAAAKLGIFSKELAVELLSFTTLAEIIKYPMSISSPRMQRPISWLS